jgi:hypothetical protein
MNDAWVLEFGLPSVITIDDLHRLRPFFGQLLVSESLPEWGP